MNAVNLAIHKGHSKEIKNCNIRIGENEIHMNNALKIITKLENDLRLLEFDVGMLEQKLLETNGVLFSTIEEYDAELSKQNEKININTKAIKVIFYSLL